MDEFGDVNAFAFVALLGKTLTFCFLIFERALCSHDVNYDLLVGLVLLVKLAAAVGVVFALRQSLRFPPLHFKHLYTRLSYQSITYAQT